MVVDTSAWIEWLTRSDLGLWIDVILPSPEHCIMPSIVLVELLRWARRELVPNAYERVIAMSEQCHVETLDQELALFTDEVYARHRLPLADSIIYACARRHRVQVLTCDAHFEPLPFVQFQRKIGPRSQTMAREPVGAWSTRRAMRSEAGSSYLA
ncbi:type II toxin-antitoxin system VapC family toxin [Roseateles aquatilis]|nr:type II toxin-antitoxin system VapC family toxin [Roseateles aquatilis]